jgi:methionine-rich copper-binding protein CopC
MQTRESTFWSPFVAKIASVVLTAMFISILSPSPFSQAIPAPASGVTNVTSAQTDAGYLTTAETATVTITFSVPVTVAGGSPTLTLETGATDAVATYTGGSGTDTLSFLYTVQNGEYSADLDYVSTTALQLNGSTIKDSNNVSLNLTLPAPGTAGSLAANKNFVVDSVNPTISSSLPADNSAGFAPTANIVLNFSETVTATSGNFSIYLSSNNSLVETATVTSGIVSITGSQVIINPVATLTTGASYYILADAGLLVDAAGNQFSGITNATTLNFSVGDGVAPTVTNVTSSTANGTYKTGDAIVIQVTFSETVTVTSTPQITLETGATDRVVNYTAGSTTNTLEFTYTVQAGDVSSDLTYLSTSALALNGGGIADSSGTPAVLTLPAVSGAGSLAGNKAIVIDTAGPTVVSSSPAVSETGTALSKVITITFNENISLGAGVIKLRLTSDTATVTSTIGVSGNTLTITPTSNLTASTQYCVTIEPTAIRDSVGNYFAGWATTGDLSFTTGAANAGSVTNITSTKTNGTYGPTEVIGIQVVFSDSATVTSGTPTIILATGATSRTAAYVSGSGTTTLLFEYTVQSGDVSSDLDYVATSSLQLNGAFIRNGAGDSLSTILPAPGAASSLGANKALVIDGVAPNLSSAIPSDGAVGVALDANIVLTFNENVRATSGNIVIKKVSDQTTFETIPLTDARVTGLTTNILTINPSGTFVGGTKYAINIDVNSIKDSYGNAYVGITDLTSLTFTTVSDIAITTPANVSSYVGLTPTITPTVTGGVGTKVFSIVSGTLPAGLALNISTGVITGQLTTVVSPATSITLRVTDSSGSSATTSAFTILVAEPSFRQINSGAFRSGAAGGENSLNTDGTLKQTWYLNSGTFYKMTYSNYSLNYAMGVGTGVAGPWHGSSLTTPLVLKSGTTPTYDYSGFIGTGTIGSGGITGYGTIIYTALITIGSGAYASNFELKNTYVIAQNARTLRVTSVIKNTMATTVQNVSLWVGSQDDWIGNSDVSLKTKGNITVANGVGTFTQISNAAATANTLTISNGAEIVYFYTTATNSNISYRGYDVFQNTVNTNPTTVATSLNNDGSYAFYLPIGTMTPSQTASFTWYYAVGSNATEQAAIVTGLGTLGSDNIPPTISSIALSSNAGGDSTYKVGDVITATINLSEVVTVTGTPRIAIDGLPGKYFTYSSGTGTQALVFSYTVVSGDIAALGTGIATNSLELNSGTIKDGAGNSATLAHSAVAVSTSHKVDGVIPTLSSSTPANSATAVNITANIVLGFSEAIFAGIGNITIKAGSNILETISVTDSKVTISGSTVTINPANNLGSLTAYHVLIDSTAFVDAAGNAYAGIASSSTLVFTSANASAATVLNVSGVDGRYKTGNTISISVQFNKVLTVTGTPQLTLETGASDTVVNYSSGSGTDTLVFIYTVASGNTSSDLDYASTSALALNGGTIIDGNAVNASLLLAVPGQSGSLGANNAIIVDTTAPTVTNVTSPTTNGTYKAGSVVAITITFSEAVTVTGTPQLTLETGATDAVVNYSSGSGTATLTFNYTVATGDTSSDLDYVATSSLALNGGSIADAATNTAVLTLPTPRATYSLRDNKNLVIDTTAPTFSSSTHANGLTRVGPDSNIEVNFSENIAAGTGNVVIYDSSGTAVETIAITNGAKITITNNQIVINPSTTLTIDSNYYLNIASTAVLDAAGNSFAGISSSSTISWVVQAALSGPDPSIKYCTPSKTFNWSDGNFDELMLPNGYRIKFSYLTFSGEYTQSVQVSLYNADGSVLANQLSTNNFETIIGGTPGLYYYNLGRAANSAWLGETSSNVSNGVKTAFRFGNLAYKKSDGTLYSQVASGEYVAFRFDTGSGYQYGWFKPTLTVSGGNLRVVIDSYAFKVAAGVIFAGDTGSNTSNCTGLGNLTDAPTGVTATLSAGVVNVSWTAPSYTGAAPITDYAIQYSSDNGANWTSYSDGVSASTTASVRGIATGFTYLFRVTAITRAGNSSPSTASAGLTLSNNVPGTPIIGTATASGTTTATVAYSAPSSNGGSTILNYTATSSPGSVTTTVNTAASGTITVTGLTPATAYTFTVVATNAAGTSVTSSASNQITTSCVNTTQQVLTFSALEAAVSAACSGTTVELLRDIVATSTLIIAKPLTLDGKGFSLSVSRPGLNTDGSVATSPSTYRAIDLTATGAVTLQYLKIQGGDIQGAGVRIGANTIATLSYVYISESRNSSGGGAAIYNQNITYLKNSYIYRNSGSSSPGFLNPSGKKLFVENTTFSNNRTEASGANGGAGENIGYLYINNSTFSDNQSTGIGGALYNSGTAYIVNTSMTGNVAYGGTHGGGAIGNQGGTVYLVSSLLAFNYRLNSGTSDSPTSFVLDDIGWTDATVTNGSGFNLIYTTLHTQIASSNAIDTIGNTSLGTITVNLPAQILADGSNDSIFTGGVYTRIANSSGSLIGTGNLWRPFSISRNLATAPALKTNLSFPFGKGAPTRYFADASALRIAYKAAGSWVNLTGSATSSDDVLLDQYGTTRSTSAPATGSIEKFEATQRIVQLVPTTGGTVSGASVYGDVVANGSTITLVAQPLTGYRFGYWNVTQSPTRQELANPLVLTIPANTTVQPVFIVVENPSEFSLTYSPNNATTGAPPASEVTTTTFTVSGNTGNLLRTNYRFAGWNTSANGAGTPYTAGTPITPTTNIILYATWIGVTAATAPGAPTIGSATATSSTTATVAFSQPSDDGGATITTYTVTSTPSGGSGSISQAGSGTINVTGLTAGTSYRFTVVATNSVGNSSASSSSNSITTTAAATAPGAPTIGAATATGQSTATVAFTAPVSNGGSAITGYTVTSSPGGITATGTTSPITVTGLSAGTSYTFTIAATNAVGTSSSSSASNGVTTTSAPSTSAPGAPTIGAATATGQTTATVAFTAPVSNGGSSITGYRVTSSPGGITATGTSSPITVTGLSAATSYTFTVTATNSIGTSSASGSSSSITTAAASVVVTPTPTPTPEPAAPVDPAVIAAQQKYAAEAAAAKKAADEAAVAAAIAKAAADLDDLLNPPGTNSPVYDVNGKIPTTGLNGAAAIILDKKVRSAPIITRSPYAVTITFGTTRIELSSQNVDGTPQAIASTKPISFKLGSSLTIKAQDFYAASTITTWLLTTPSKLDSSKIDPQGNSIIKFRLLAPTEIGAHNLQVNGRRVNKQAFSVTLPIMILAEAPNTPGSVDPEISDEIGKDVGPGFTSPAYGKTIYKGVLFVKNNTALDTYEKKAIKSYLPVVAKTSQVTCIGFTYSKKPGNAEIALAKKQATAACKSLLPAKNAKFKIAIKDVKLAKKTGRRTSVTKNYPVNIQITTPRKP